MNIDDISFIHKEYCEYYKGYSLVGSYDIYIPFYRVVMQMNYIAESEMNFLEEFICKCVERGFQRKNEICKVLEIEEYIIDFALKELVDKKLLVLENENINFTEEGKVLFNQRIKLEQDTKNISWYYDGIYPQFKNSFFCNNSKDLLRFRDIEKIDKAFFITPLVFPKYDIKSDFEDLSYEVIKYLNSENDYGNEKVVNINCFNMTRDREVFYRKYLLMMFKNREGNYKLLAYDNSENGAVDLTVTGNLQRIYEEEKLLEVISCENKDYLSELVYALNNLDKGYNSYYLEALEPTEEDTENVEKDSIDILNDDENNVIELSEYKEEYLMNYEIREKFIYFLKNAKESLYIISPWMNNYIINDEFINDIKRLLENGVKIRIMYGISHANDISQDFRNKKTNIIAEKLKQIGTDYGDLLKIEHGQTHEKLCVCDRKYYINGSFNFLSYSGEETNSGFRNEGSTYSQNMKLIDTVIKMRFGE